MSSDHARHSFATRKAHTYICAHGKRERERKRERKREREKEREKERKRERERDPDIMLSYKSSLLHAGDGIVCGPDGEGSPHSCSMYIYIYIYNPIYIYIYICL